MKTQKEVGRPRRGLKKEGSEVVAYLSGERGGW